MNSLSVQFNRETELLKEQIIPSTLLSEWLELVKKYNIIPSYNSEYGCWYIQEINDSTDSIMKDVKFDISENKRRIAEWNKKAKLLSSLGINHIFVKGYLSSEPGFWSFMSRGDGECCLYNKKYKKRSAKEFLDFIAPRLKKLWPTGFDSDSVGFYLGHFTKAYFEYNGSLPNLKGVDINSKTSLSDFVLSL